MTLTLPSGLTQAQAARLAGVTTRTIQNWLRGRGAPSPQQAAILEVAAESAAIEAAEPMSLAERIAALKAIADEQYRQANRLEDWLAEARRQHGTTMTRLNALYAERSRSRAE